MTDKTEKALIIIRDHPGIRPSQFAELMWPDSSKRSGYTKCGRGVTRGGGMRLAAGGYLGRLRRDGWITYRNNLTPLAIEKLAAT